MPFILLCQSPQGVSDSQIIPHLNLHSLCTAHICLCSFCSPLLENFFLSPMELISSLAKFLLLPTSCYTFSSPSTSDWNLPSWRYCFFGGFSVSIAFLRKRWEYQTTWPASWETCMHARNNRLVANKKRSTSKVYIVTIMCRVHHTEKAMAPHSSTLACKIPWTEEPGRLQSMGLRRVRHNWATSLSRFTFMHWRRKWQPTPVFLPGESQGRGSLVGCHLWGRTESDTTEVT